MYGCVRGVGFRWGREDVNGEKMSGGGVRGACIRALFAYTCTPQKKKKNSTHLQPTSNKTKDTISPNATFKNPIQTSIPEQEFGDECEC